MIKCPNCGSNLRFDAKSQQVLCDNCDSTFDPKTFNKEAKKAQALEGKLYLCSQCGAELLSFDDTAVTFCSYCDSQAMIEEKQVELNNPEVVIPFKKTKEECIKNYKDKINSSLFAPNYLKNDITVNKFRGIYMPYAVCKASYHGPISASGEKFSHQASNYKYYDKYEINGDADIEYNGVSYDLVSKFYDSYSKAIPFDYKDAVDYNHNYMLGFYADSKDVDVDVYDKQTVEISTEHADKNLYKYDEFNKYNAYPKVKLTIDEHKVGMYPVYFMATKNRDGDKVHYAVVNGQTGKVAADIPVSFAKYISFSTILALIIFICLIWVPVIEPYIVLIISMVFSFISILISNSQLDKIKAKEEYADDLGYQSIHKTNNEEKNKKSKSKSPILIILLIITLIGWIMNPVLGMMLTMISLTIISITLSTSSEDTNERILVKEQRSKKMAYAYKQIIAIIISIAVLIINPIEDLYYYAVAIVSFILIILSFYTLVNEHNKLTSRKPPQLEKRGGDENE